MKTAEKELSTMKLSIPEGLSTEKYLEEYFGCSYTRPEDLPDGEAELTVLVEGEKK